MKRLFVILFFVVFTVFANGNYKLDMHEWPIKQTSDEIYGECIQESDREYCVLYTLGYLGYYAEENTQDMDNFILANSDMFLGSEQKMVDRLHTFFTKMLRDDSTPLQEAEYICIVSGAIGALFYASTIGKEFSAEDAFRWAKVSCKTGVAPYRISMYDPNKVTYIFLP